MLEKIIENAIKDFIKDHENSLVFSISPDGTIPKNFPDLIGGFKGMPFAVEVKSETGKPARGQLIMLKLFKRAGFVTGIVRSVEDFEQLFT